MAAKAELAAEKTEKEAGEADNNSKRDTEEARKKAKAEKEKVLKATNMAKACEDALKGKGEIYNGKHEGEKEVDCVFEV